MINIDGVAQFYEPISGTLITTNDFCTLSRRFLVVALQKTGSPIPRGDNRAWLVCFREKRNKLISRQPRSQHKPLIAPEAVRILIRLLGNKPEDAQRLEITRQRYGGASFKNMLINRHGLRPPPLLMPASRQS